MAHGLAETVPPVLPQSTRHVHDAVAARPPFNGVKKQRDGRADLGIIFKNQCRSGRGGKEFFICLVVAQRAPDMARSHDMECVVVVVGQKASIYGSDPRCREANAVEIRRYCLPPVRATVQINDVYRQRHGHGLHSPLDAPSGTGPLPSHMRLSRGKRSATRCLGKCQH